MPVMITIGFSLLHAGPMPGPRQDPDDFISGSVGEKEFKDRKNWTGKQRQWEGVEGMGKLG